MGVDAIADVDIDGSGKFLYIFCSKLDLLLDTIVLFFINRRPKMHQFDEKIWYEAMLAV